MEQADRLCEAFPGNSQLYLIWADLVQLQEHPQHSLDEARAALETAIKLDDGSPAALLELGHYLDAVEDDPKAAAATFAQAAAIAKKAFVEALVGQAKSLLQLHRGEDAVHYLLEALQLVGLNGTGRNGKARNSSNGASIPAEIETLLQTALN